jgi:hypothetical protein
MHPVCFICSSEPMSNRKAEVIRLPHPMVQGPHAFPVAKKADSVGLRQACRAILEHFLSQGLVSCPGVR